MASNRPEGFAVGFRFFLISIARHDGSLRDGVPNKGALNVGALNVGGWNMSSLIIVAVIIGIVTAIQVYAAGIYLPVVHMILAAALALFIAISCYRDNEKAIGEGRSIWALAQLNARYMGLVWAWGALTLLATYTLVLSWKEWWQFFAASLAFAALCLLFSRLLTRDGEQGDENSTMLSLSRKLAIAQLVGMIIAMVGLLIDGKMIRYLTPRYTDWPANNVFFFGALALALISLIALRSQKRLSG